MPEDHEISHLLQAAARGDSAVRDRLWSLLYPSLNRMAEHAMLHDPMNSTLQPGALVDEAYLRLSAVENPAWKNRVHFYATAARIMRHILVDRARARQAEKRGGARQRVTLEAADTPVEGRVQLDVLALEEALGALARQSRRQARIVELRFFAGLDVEQTARVLGISPRTVKSEWAEAREFLRAQLDDFDD
jgi:RNA polymerase sigma-70 factor, ECF subfamily